MVHGSGRLQALAIFAILLAVVAHACDGGDNPEVSKPHSDAGGADGSGGSGGKPDGSDEDATADAGGDQVTPDGAASPVFLGIVPTPSFSGDAGPSAADEKLAELEVVALGSRGVSKVLRWDSLFESPSAPKSQEWSKLAGLASLHASTGRRLLVTLALVDRTLDARPAGSTASWNDTPTRNSLDALIDRVFATFGDELYALSFGNELDRFFAKQNPTNAAALAALVEHGIDYARAHPGRPPALLVGATFSADALAKTAPPLVEILAQKSDAWIVTHYPLDASFQVRPATNVAQELDALGSGLAADAGADAEAGAARPVLLQEVGYPSSAENGSSPELQRAFYQALFQALAVRRERFPFVGVNGLTDADPARCASEAAAIGAPGSSAALASRCTLGLRMPDKTGKPALTTVLEALASFSAP